LEYDKGDNPSVDISGPYFRRRYGFQIEERKSERRRQKRSLKINRYEDTEPERIKSELNHNRSQHRHMNEGDFDKIKEKSDDKDKPHHNGQNKPFAVRMGNPGEKSSD